MRLLIAIARITAQYASGAATLRRLRHAVHSDQPTSSSIASGVFTPSVTGKKYHTPKCCRWPMMYDACPSRLCTRISLSPSKNRGAGSDTCANSGGPNEKRNPAQITRHAIAAAASAGRQYSRNLCRNGVHSTPVTQVHRRKDRRQKHQQRVLGDQPQPHRDAQHDRAPPVRPFGPQQRQRKLPPR